jgi:hypothetical protein
MNVQQAYSRLGGFRSLAQGWDSYSGKPISPKAIDKAYELLGLLRDGWTPVPCSDGSVQLESHENGVDIEIRISET